MGFRNWNLEGSFHHHCQISSYIRSSPSSSFLSPSSPEWSLEASRNWPSPALTIVSSKKLNRCDGLCEYVTDPLYAHSLTYLISFSLSMSIACHTNSGRHSYTWLTFSILVKQCPHYSVTLKKCPHPTVLLITADSLSVPESNFCALPQNHLTVTQLITKL